MLLYLELTINLPFKDAETPYSIFEARYLLKFSADSNPFFPPWVSP